VIGGKIVIVMVNHYNFDKNFTLGHCQTRNQFKHSTTTFSILFML